MGSRLLAVFLVLASAHSAGHSPVGVFEGHWAYVPVRRPEPPTVRTTSWIANPIDNFVLHRLEKRGIAPAAPADRRTLIRRLSFDLRGLPPTVAEVEAFVSDRSSDAWRRLVDRLLADPAWGEHQAARWLDLARYADTRGYEKDQRRDAWPYRDWVIRAFDADMPFDEFTKRQLAGDLMPKPKDARAREDLLIATAFHRMTMTNDEGGTDDEEFRDIAVVDRVNTTFEVWMGMTMGCARCHDHKFDPISQREYYELFAFFNQTADTDSSSDAPLLRIARGESKRKLAQLKRRVRLARTEPERAAARTALTKFQNSLPGLPILRELQGKARRVTHIHERGFFLNQGKVVEPGVPHVLHAFPAGAPRNRLGLAAWLTSPDNPLTARVLVNRYWSALFGAGFVRTPTDWGTRGDKPTHPGLLDWLAADVVAHGWSIKQLVRRIVMSSTYRQSSVRRRELETIDPTNTLLARGPRRRLGAEAIRDATLAVSGLLDRRRFGPPVMPPQPAGLWRMAYSQDHWKTAVGPNRYRRAIYTFWRRTSPYPSLATLDEPSREFCVTERPRTNTPLQALVLLNDPAFVEAAQELGRRTARTSGTDAAAGIREIFAKCLSRAPAAAEQARLERLFGRERARLASNSPKAKLIATSVRGKVGDATNLPAVAAWTLVSSVVLNLDEFLVKR